MKAENLILLGDLVKVKRYSLMDSYFPPNLKLCTHPGFRVLAHGLRETDSVCVLHCLSGLQGLVCKEELKEDGVKDASSNSQGARISLPPGGQLRPAALVPGTTSWSAPSAPSPHPPRGIFLCTELSKRQRSVRLRGERPDGPVTDLKHNAVELQLPWRPACFGQVGTGAASAAAGKRPQPVGVLFGRLSR